MDQRVLMKAAPIAVQGRWRRRGPELPSIPRVRAQLRDPIMQL